MTNCSQCQTDFNIPPEDEKFCEQLKVPVPRQCPECRLIRRLQERNARKLYYRTCDFSGKKIISIYHEEQPFPVYDQEIWWSDSWDAMEYGQDIDFKRPFFEQFKELLHRVPHPSVFICGGTLENSEFTNCVGYLKNCYLIFESDYNEDCSYSNRIYHSKNLLDCTNCYKCEHSYQCIDCENCYGLQYSQECENCQESFFLKNCIGCKDCIGCINQRHKQYMILNQQYSKEDYERKKTDFRLDTHEGLKKFQEKAEDFFRTQPHKAMEGEHNENVIGDHVYDSKNAFQCFDCKDLEDCRYCAKVASGVKNCMDYTAWGFNAELIYQTVSCGDNAHNLKFCTTCVGNISNLEYCSNCTSSKNLFGCVGLNKKQYCIFNKQYSEKEFHLLREKLIHHMKETPLRSSRPLSGSEGRAYEWGEFFPIDLCPFGYNETIAMDHFPFTKEEALAKGYKWSDYEMPPPEVEKTIPASTLPETIAELPEEMLEWAIVGEVTKKPFRINKQELALYREMNIPCPKRHPLQRHADRMKKRPLYRLRTSNCSHCKKGIICNIPSKKLQEILCEECYEKSVYNAI